MRNHRRAVVLAVAALVAATVAVSPAAGAPGPDRGPGLEVFTGTLDAVGLAALRAAGLDHEDIATAAAPGGAVAVEVVMDERLAAKLREQGVDLDVKQVRGQDASDAAAARARAGYEGFRSYSEDGGIAEELRETAADHPVLAKLIPYGTSVNGQDILAVKVTKDANRTRDGSRPAVMYLGAQHAREWITPEMVRRLMHHYLDGYGSDPQITRLVDTTELWFVPVANPDGYDYTFTEDNRLWRKNLADNDRDGSITGSDGVDLNRNFPLKWGYDNEGSSPEISSTTYRGPRPGSEPETVALDALFARVGFEFFVNYHSAAELLLYGIGWQVTPPLPTTSSTRPWRAPTTTRPCPATTRTSPRSSTRPSATPTRT